MKFSIGIPVFKATFLKECIDSILEQTFVDYELIIVNDASPEDIDNIINSYSDSRIRYYKNERNFGAVNVVDNWNKCLSYALGEYFVLMGDDDKMCFDYLEEFNLLINKHPKLGVYHCRSMIIDKNSNFITLTETRPEIESVYENIWHRLQVGRLQFISDFVYRTESLKREGGFYKLPLAWASDDLSSYIAMDKGIANTNKPVFMYRDHSHTISSSGNVHFKMKAIQLEREWLEKFLKENNPQTEVDKYIKQMITNSMNKHYIKKKIYTISDNLKISIISRLYYWFKIRKNYDLSLSMLIYAVIVSIKDTWVEKI
ncbi:MAG TPA: glycosyltransferase family 2 protein [Candidatus Paceibacterota bacterium]